MTTFVHLDSVIPNSATIWARAAEAKYARWPNKLGWSAVILGRLIDVMVCRPDEKAKNGANFIAICRSDVGRYHHTAGYGATRALAAVAAISAMMQQEEE